MKKIFKTLFVIISIAAICGCAYFGYMYFKDKSGGSITLTSADAKELAFAAAYDLDVITAVDFKDNIGKTPINKPTNYGKNWDDYDGDIVDINNTSETYNDYTDDNIYFWVDDHLVEFSMPAIDRDLNNVCNFFKKDITANTYYSLGGIKGYYTLEKNVLTFRFWNTDADPTYYSYYATEYVVKYTALSKNSDGFVEYSVDIECFETEEYTPASITYNDSKLYMASFSVGKNSDNNKQLNDLYATLTFVSETIRNYSDLEIDGTTMTTYTYDCDIVDNKILYYYSNLEEPFQRTVNKFSNDVHFNVPEFYADKTINTL